MLQAHDGMTALHLAAKSGRKEVLRVLLDTRKIDINTQVSRLDYNFHVDFTSFNEF